MKQIVFYICAGAIFATTLLLSGCTQNEGIGGNSHVEGLITEKFYNEDFTIFQYEQPAKDEDVFILFGEDNTVGENTSTSYTGNFEFKYLWPGDYKIYYYSEDTTGTKGEDIELIQDINLSAGETLKLDQLVKYSTLDWNDGNAKIKGSVSLINYKDGSEYPNLVIKDITPAQEYDVYINYNNSDFYTDKIETQADGTFVFPHLILGYYTVYVYSEDVSGGTQNLVKSYKIIIDELDQIIELEQFVVEKI